jgi:hypothetical protein
VEKARKAVDSAIRHARELIADQLPSLADHLAKAIRPGRDCSYQPDTSIKWVFSIPDLARIIHEFHVARFSVLT